MSTASGRRADAEAYSHVRAEHWNRVADGSVRWNAARKAYHHRLSEIYGHLVSPGQRVLEIGCGLGDLLAHLRPETGVGIDFSCSMVRTARTKHPGNRLVVADAHALPLTGQFDVVILSDLVNDLFDVQLALDQIRPLLGRRGRLILNFYSPLWEIPLRLAQRFKAATPYLRQNWLSTEDVRNLLMLSDFEMVRHWEEVLIPDGTRLVNIVANRYLAHLWPFRMAALTHFVVARPLTGLAANAEPRVSVVIPARNEEGNISAIFERTPTMGSDTELVFVEGNSHDQTYAEVKRQIECHPTRTAKLLKQSGRGKADAVRLGFDEASGDVLMILDADLTVPPEDLPRFYDALRAGKGDFINGVRLIYPMQKQAMQFLNLMGNKFFSVVFSWLIGQPIKDTLCGTKVLHKRDYERIRNQRAYFGEFDPFGDFDLLFGAARLNMKIVDMPVRYGERTYGTTNIQRWRHGLLLLRMVVFGARRIKFV